eukprot:scaffold68758_cov18-Phaeocystis_antarctica.AAC.1
MCGAGCPGYPANIRVCPWPGNPEMRGGYKTADNSGLVGVERGSQAGLLPARVCPRNCGD